MLVALTNKKETNAFCATASVKQRWKQNLAISVTRSKTVKQLYMTDNLEVVRAEVERRKQRAWELGLPQLTTRFYRDVARFYPASQTNNSAMIQQIVTDIRDARNDTVEFQDKDHRYSLAWKEHCTTLPDGDVYFSSTLTLLVDENRVLEMHLVGDEDLTDWRPDDVLAFIEGPWISSFKAVVAEDERLRKRAERDRRCREAEELRSRFGIPDNTSIERVQPAHGRANRFGLIVGRLLSAIRK